jgi:hypothetical protein
MTEEEIIIRAVDSGRAAARKATQAYLDAHGDRDCCGFAWLTVYTDGRSRVGRALIKAGFKKTYGQSGIQMWNPSGHMTQALTAKEVGAEAMAQELRTRLGVEAYAGSRMD